MTTQEIKQLSILACKVRMGIIESTHAAKCGHPGGSMSATELFTYLYNKELNVDPANPKWEDRAGDFPDDLRYLGRGGLRNGLGGGAFTGLAAAGEQQSRR